jgi:type I restriction enzyme S subunit
MSNLPVSWINVQLGDVVDYGNTSKAEPTEIAKNSWILELEDIEKTSSKLIQRILFSERQSKSTKNKFEKNDVLYGKLRPYLDKVIIANKSGYCTTEIIPIKPGKYLDNRFLFYGLKRKEFIDYVSEVSHGLNMPRLGTKQGQAAPFVLAPLNEQIRIAAKLDSVLAKVDAAQARLEKIPTLLKRFRQSVLAAATSGELTREWRAENKIDATYTTLGEAGIEVKTGPFGSALHKEEYVSDGIPVINPMHIRDGSIYPTAEMTITKDKFKELKAWKLEVGDVVIGRRGEMGRAAEITSYDADLLCGTGSMIIRSNTGLISSAYLCLVLRSPNSVAYFESNSVGSTMVNLNQKIIKNLNFHYPSSEEQKEIVRRVESLFTLADTVEKQYLETKKRIDRLTQSLLAKAFRGELVPQDPNDEPAAELLKRIQAERNAQPPAKNKRSKPA